MSAASHDFGRDEYGWQSDAHELGEFFCGYESAIGFRSTFSAMIAASEGVSLGTGPRANWDPYAEMVDRNAHYRETYRTLKRMNNEEVVILFRLYGMQNAASSTLEFGELSGLVAYTEAAEQLRDDFVLRESTRSEETVSGHMQTEQRRSRSELEALFWGCAWSQTMAEAERERLAETVAAKQGRCRGLMMRALDLLESKPRLAWEAAIAAMKIPAWLDGAARRDRRLVEQIAADRVLQGIVLDEWDRTTSEEGRGSLRARLGAITWTDRHITTEDAITARLTYRGRRDADGKPDPDAHAAWVATKAVFVETAMKQAISMKRRAHAAYRLAKEV